jgi:hypothetical protein
MNSIKNQNFRRDIMLTFDEKVSIIRSFPKLERKDVSLNRVNFQFVDSVYEKKNIVYHLHPNGNGYIYAEGLKEYSPDQKGMVNIRDFSEEELRSILEKAIHSLSTPPERNEEYWEDENWINNDNQTLLLVKEEDMWNTYAGLNLDGTFPSYNEAKQYLEEEGFKRK